MRTAYGGVEGAVLVRPSPHCVMFSACSPLAGAALDGGLQKARHGVLRYQGLCSSARHGGLSYQGLQRSLLVKRRQLGKKLVVVRACSEEEPRRNQDGEADGMGKTGPVDWDNAWSSFKNPSLKKSFLKIDMEQYVSRKPEHSNYPISEEVDPLRKSERSALGAWTSLKFTYVFMCVIIGLAVYMVIIVGPPPHH